MQIIRAIAIYDEVAATLLWQQQSYKGTQGTILTFKDICKQLLIIVFKRKTDSRSPTALITRRCIFCNQAQALNHTQQINCLQLKRKFKKQKCLEGVRFTLLCGVL